MERIDEVVEAANKLIVIAGATNADQKSVLIGIAANIVIAEIHAKDRSPEEQERR
jgi:hypothetical protein